MQYHNYLYAINLIEFKIHGCNAGRRIQGVEVEPWELVCELMACQTRKIAKHVKLLSFSAVNFKYQEEVETLRDPGGCNPRDLHLIPHNCAS